MYTYAVLKVVCKLLEGANHTKMPVFIDIVFSGSWSKDNEYVSTVNNCKSCFSHTYLAN